jgi:hypothetical protein
MLERKDRDHHLIKFMFHLQDNQQHHSSARRIKVDQEDQTRDSKEEVTQDFNFAHKSTKLINHTQFEIVIYKKFIIIGTIIGVLWGDSLLSMHE